MKKGDILFTVTILFAALLVFSATPVAIAQQNITIKVIAYDNYVEPYIDGFKKLVKDKYNTDLTFIINHAHGSNDIYKLARAKAVDILSPSHNLLKNDKFRFIETQLIKPLDLSRVPNYKNVLSVLKNSDFLKEGGKVYGVPYTMGPYALAYNADKVPAPDSWKVLWDDKSKGQYALSDDFADCNIYVTALANGVTINEIYDFDIIKAKIGMDTFREELKKLATNAHSFWEGTADTDVMKSLSYVATWGYAVQQANLDGQNWKLASPKEGYTAWFDNWVISSSVEDGSLKETILYEWINYCLSTEVQVGVVRNWGVSPVTTDVAPHLTADEITTFNVGNEAFWNNVSFWGVLSRLTENGFKGLWRTARQ